MISDFYIVNALIYQVILCCSYDGTTVIITLKLKILDNILAGQGRKEILLIDIVVFN